MYVVIIIDGDLGLFEVPCVSCARVFRGLWILSPCEAAFFAFVNRISTAAACYVSEVEIPIGTTFNVGAQTSTIATEGGAWDLRTPSIATVKTGRAKWSLPVTIDAEYPSCGV